MDYLAGMRAFVRAVELGSFSKAAAEAGMKVSTVSRYVTGLEADLGAALLNRSTRRLHLTEVGSSFYDNTVRILADIDDAQNDRFSTEPKATGIAAHQHSICFRPQARHSALAAIPQRTSTISVSMLRSPTTPSI